jgi:PAS domain S-box-containing protein
VKIQQSLRQSEERFRILFESAPDAYFLTDEKGTFVDGNKAAERLSGYERNELKGKNFLSLHLLPDSDLESAAQNLARSAQGQSVGTEEFTLERKNGEVVSVEIRNLPVTIHDEKLILGIARDITERKRAAESHFLLTTALESTANGVVITDVKGNIVWVNRAFTEMTGYTQSEVLGKNPRILKSGKQEGSLYRVLWETISAGNVWHGEIINKKKDGSLYYEEMTITPLKNTNGAIAYFIAIKRDITERKQIEETLSESERRFHQLFDEAPVGYHELDIQGRIVQVNRTELEMLGYEAKEMLGHPVWEFIVESDTSREAIQAKFADSAPSNHTYERTFRRRDGTSLHALITDRGLRDKSGHVVGIRSTVQDNTERKLSEEMVQDSEERFRMVFDHAFDGISIYSEDPDPSKRRLIDCNDRYAAMAGRSRDELLQLGSTQGLQTTLQRTANKNRLDSLTKGTAYEGSFSWNRPDAKDNVIEYMAMPITWRGKSYSIGIDRDMTERKKGERELRLMAQTVASAQDCISITDLKDNILFVNDAFRNAYGYAAQELLGKHVSILRSPLVPTAITDQILDNTLAGGWHGEILNRRKDGSDLPVELWTSAVRDEGGNPVAMVGVARDITTRKVVEEHLKQSEEQFRLIAENVADMIAVVDLEGRRIYNSPSYKHILGDPELLKSTDGFQEIHPDDVAMVKRVFQETVRTGIGQRIEYRFLLSNGSMRDIDSKGSVIKDSNGKVSQVIIVSRDVTEEKKLAAQFLRAQRMESIGTLASGIAHDLNNVLAPILMAIEVLRDKVSDPGGLKILSTIETSAKRGADIVKQVLAFGRGLKGERILLQLKHVVNELVKIFSQTFPKSIEIKTDIPRDLWTVSADPTQIHQVLLNMMVNARDAMPGGGTLTISAENITLDETYSRMHLEAKPGKYVCMAITDTGVGIPADIREKIFEPFFTTKEIGMGTGLGLSTTLAIVRSHEGFINLDSEEGKGTTFRIYIPATGTAPNVPAASEEAELPTGNGELILIIDDEAAIREITKETLKAHGYKAMTASDGAEGVALFADNKEEIKVVITDIIMPVMNGTAAILVLKKIRPDVKIIAASGLTTKGQITTPSDSNVQAFLTKPYTAEKLLQTLAAVLK